MKSFHSWRLILSILSAFLLNSCGDDTQFAGGGIGGTGIISSGTIASFGSIVVNGTRFDTSYAAVMVNGEEKGIGDSVVRANLDVGKVVTVAGPGRVGENSAIASQVIYNNNLQGPVEQISRLDHANKALTVLGQPVIVTSLTRFKGGAIDTINRDDVVAVSGFRDNTGAIQATFLERTGAFTSNMIFEVNGFVSNLDTDMQTFMIGDLVVNYSQADTSQLPQGAPSAGQQVEVEGTLGATGGEMLAITVEPADSLASESADEFEVMGIVTTIAAISEFTLGNQVVIVEEGATIVDGALTDITPGVKLEAEGTLIDGILYAHEIEFWLPDQIEVEGIVTEVISDSQFTVDEQVVFTNDRTVFENGSPEDIVIGITLEIKGRPRDGVLIADKVSFENEGDQ
jgi:hypothetical protein